MAAWGKLRDPERSRAAAVGLGVPRPVAQVASTALPVLELAVAGALVVPPIAFLGSVVAVGLLAVFSALVGVNLARGRRPPCACFGQLRVRPIGPGTLVRTVALLGVAAVAVIAG